MKIVVSAAVFCLGHAAEVAACPFCSSDTGQQVRAEIFGDDFAFNVASTLIPFPVLLGIVGLIYFGLPFRRRRP